MRLGEDCVIMIIRAFSQSDLDGTGLYMGPSL